jgi:hypothetical protein
MAASKLTVARIAKLKDFYGALAEGLVELHESVEAEDEDATETSLDGIATEVQLKKHNELLIDLLESKPWIKRKKGKK